MKKICGLVLLIFLLSGCSASYNITIDNNNEFEENLYVFSETDKEVENIKKYKMPVLVDANDSTGSETIEKVDGYKYYDISKEPNYINLFTTFKNKEYSNSNIIRSCFKYFNFALDEDNYYIISTSRGFTCIDKYPDLSNVTISIKLPNSVIDVNTENINGDTYTWNINRSNAKNTSIYLKYKPKEINSNGSKEEKNELFYVLILLGVLVVLLIIFIISKKRKLNK